MAQLPQVVIASDVRERLLGKAQGLRGIDWRRRWSLAVDQAVQNIEDVGFGRHPSFEGQLEEVRQARLTGVFNGNGAEMARRGMY